MNYGGDAADQIVRYSLDGVDHGLRLSGTLAKHLAVFLAAVMKDQKKTRGRTRMVRMLKENKPLKFFTVPSDRLRKFCSEGRKRGLLYVIIKDRKNPDMSEVMVFADDAAKVNRVMDKMNLDFVKSEVGQAVHEVTGEQEKAEVSLQFHIIWHNRRKVIIGILSSLPVCHICLNTKKAILDLTHGLVCWHWENVNGQH